MAALASHDADLQKVLTSVVGAYFGAVTAQATLKARTQAVELATGTWHTTQSEAQLQDTEQQILMEVVKAHADAQSSFENL